MSTSLLIIALLCSSEESNVMHLPNIVIEGEVPDEPVKLKRIPVAVYAKEIGSAKKAFKSGDYDLAFQLMSRTARWGDKNNQYVLGMMYLKGLGVEQNLMLGYAWIKLSEEGAKRQEWSAQINYIESKMSDEEAIVAVQLVEELRLKYGTEAKSIACERVTKKGSHIKYTLCGPDLRPRENYIEMTPEEYYAGSVVKGDDG